MSDGNHWVGTWQLVPELSLYEGGPLPAGCIYDIRCEGGRVDVAMTFTMELGGTEHRVSYGGPLDGSAQALAASAGGPDALSLTRIDASTLDSAALKGGEVVAYGRRVVSVDGQLMAIVQQNKRPDGSSVRNFQVYRRMA